MYFLSRVSVACNTVIGIRILSFVHPASPSIIPPTTLLSPTKYQAWWIMRWDPRKNEWCGSGCRDRFHVCIKFQNTRKRIQRLAFWPRRSSQYWNILPATNNDKARKNIFINCFQILDNRQCKALIIERGEAYKVSSHNCPCFLPRGAFLSVAAGR